MTVESRGLAINDEVRVSFCDNAVLMALYGAGASIALSRDGAVHYFARVAATHDLPAVTGCVSDSDNSSHVASVIP